MDRILCIFKHCISPPRNSYFVRVATPPNIAILPKLNGLKHLYMSLICSVKKNRTLPLKNTVTKRGGGLIKKEAINAEGIYSSVELNQLTNKDINPLPVKNAVKAPPVAMETRCPSV